MSEENKLLEDFLKDWLECNTVCDLAKESEVMKKLKSLTGWDKVDYYMEILPGADYVRIQTLNYIFSNGITTGSINEDFALNLKKAIEKEYPGKTVKIMPTRGLCSYYAERGGIIAGF